MRILIIGLAATLLTSCDYFDKKKITTEEILQEELETLNYNDVDQYPTFDSCDSIEGKENKKHCFEQTLLSTINHKLKNHIIVVDDSVQDMIELKLTIEKSGELTITNIKMKPQTLAEIPQLDSLLRRSLDSLPTIYPAIKRNQQVRTQFTLPVELKIN